MTARFSDPLSSHQTVDSLKKDVRLRDLIVAVFAANRDKELSDSDLTDLINVYVPVPVQRNVVARARSFVEADGLVERTGEAWDEGRKRTLLMFRATKGLKAPDVVMSRRRIPSAVVPASLMVRADGNGGVVVVDMKSKRVLASRYQWTLKDLERYAQALAHGGM